MKKLSWILVGWVMMCGFAWGQMLPDSQRWIEQVDGGFVIPASTQAAQNYALGFGGDVLMGYRFTRDFNLSADLGYYESSQKNSGSNGEWAYTPLMAVARYNIGSGWFRPYLVLGMGVAFNSYSLTLGSAGKESRTETDFLTSPGLGLLFIVASGVALYVQGRVDFNFTQNTVGIPAADNPTLFIPIKGGVTFFAL